jgi:hypothetical protein
MIRSITTEKRRTVRHSRIKFTGNSQHVNPQHRLAKVALGSKKVFRSPMGILARWRQADEKVILEYADCPGDTPQFPMEPVCEHLTRSCKTFAVADIKCLGGIIIIQPVHLPNRVRLLPLLHSASYYSQKQSSTGNIGVSLFGFLLPRILSGFTFLVCLIRFCVQCSLCFPSETEALPLKLGEGRNRESHWTTR